MTLTSRVPRIRTALPGPNAQAMIARDRAALSPSYVRPYPFVPDRGEGVWVTDVDGNEFLDFMAGIAVSSTGYNHPHVTRAVQAQVERYMHVCLSDFPQPESVRLAERLNLLSGGGYRAFFGNSGAEAVEGAIKIARHFTGRSLLISTLGSFHGRTMGALSLTGSKANYRRGFGPLLPGVTHIPYPNPYRPVFGATRETVGEAVLEHLEHLFRTVLPPDEVAAFILEPLQGEGGYIVPPDGFLEAVRAICDRHGIMLILDEVQSGVGRTGKFHAHQHWNVRADIITLGKGIASGLPLSAILARDEIMTWPQGAHGSTFGGNPVATAAANATLDLLTGSSETIGPDEISENSLMANAARVGEALMDGLRDLQLEFPQIGEVRGKGLFIGVEIVGSEGQPVPEYRDRLAYHAFELGLLNLPCGASSLRFSPPLNLSEDEARVGLEVFRQALLETRTG